MKIDLPLEGVRILDLSLLLPGPLCSMYLGDMGAEVIKVENPRAADGTRYMFKNENGVPGLYLMLNRNKKSITLNLKKKESQEIIFKLLESTDVLLEGFRPDALSDMGLGYEILSERFPRLIYCGIYGYNPDSRWKDFAGHDGNYLALSGVLELIGSREKPVLPGIQLADIAGGSLTALSGILAALYRREKTGVGRKIDVSMMESSLQFYSLYLGIYYSTGKLPERGNELLSGRLPNYNIYTCRDGRHVMLGALEERFFRSFLRAIKMETKLETLPLQEDNFLAWKEILTNFFQSSTLESLRDVFENTDTCLTPIKNFQEILHDSEYFKNGLFFHREHPEYGKILQMGSPFSFIRKNEYRGHPPLHGQHTEEILGSIGFGRERIDQWKEKRVI